MPRVRISWPYGCKHLAMVAGSWTQWHPQVLIPSQVSYSSEEIWSTEISLPDNVDEVFRFKFIIDGEWMYNSGLPVIPNNHGSFDNYIKVCHFTYGHFYLFFSIDIAETLHFENSKS